MTKEPAKPTYLKKRLLSIESIIKNDVAPKETLKGIYPNILNIKETLSRVS
jgi:hypothetical protein